MASLLEQAQDRNHWWRFVERVTMTPELVSNDLPVEKRECVNCNQVINRVVE